MKNAYFITGTDTGVGKTWFTVLLMRYLQSQGLKVNGMKPVASGANWSGDKLINEDALLIQEFSSSKLEYEMVNPCVYEPPVAPHIAAETSGRPIDLERIVSAFHALQTQSDVVLVEGVGGWRVPINDTMSLSGLVKEMGLPVILVVGLRLGCINHTLLSVDAIRHDGLEFEGWALSELDPDYLYKEETLLTIEKITANQLLAEVPNCQADNPGKAELLMQKQGRTRFGR